MSIEWLDDRLNFDALDDAHRALIEALSWCHRFCFNVNFDDLGRTDLSREKMVTTYFREIERCIGLFWTKWAQVPPEIARTVAAYAAPIHCPGLEQYETGDLRLTFHEIAAEAAGRVTRDVFAQLPDRSHETLDRKRSEKAFAAAHRKAVDNAIPQIAKLLADAPADVVAWEFGRFETYRRLNAIPPAVDPNSFVKRQVPTAGQAPKSDATAAASVTATSGKWSKPMSRAEAAKRLRIDTRTLAKSPKYELAIVSEKRIRVRLDTLSETERSDIERR